jgi:thiamine biosynthesis protein ThiI
MEEVLLVRYGEIGLKGENRSEFEDALARHVRQVVRSEPGARVSRSRGRLYVTGVAPSRELLGRLSRVPGVVAVNPAFRVGQDLESIEAAAVQASLSAVAAKRPPVTFKVDSRRSDKSFPLTSPEINKALGDAVLRSCPGLSVDVHAPSFTLKVEVRSEGVYLYWDEVPGPGGLPLGTSGKALLLISGGIDSPVAGYLAMKRGVELDAVHFWSYPITSERSKDKVIRLAQALRGYDPRLRLFIAPFTGIQTAIMEKCPERYRVIVMRRMMMRVACRLAVRTGALAVFTGENVGQVASQTLESLGAIEDAASMPVLRPLVCFDKVETVALARKIGTYDLSILPYEDCCTVFVPKHPVIKPRLEDVREAEGGLDVEGLVEDCARSVEEAPLADPA